MPKKIIVSNRSSRTTLYDFSKYVLRYIFTSSEDSEVTLESIKVGELISEIEFNWSTDRSHLVHSIVRLVNQNDDWMYVKRTLVTFMVDISMKDGKLFYKDSPLKSMSFEEECKVVIFELEDGTTELKDLDSSLMD